jgi:uncharacterized protein (DUF4415 family)
MIFLCFGNGCDLIPLGFVIHLEISLDISCLHRKLSKNQKMTHRKTLTPYETLSEDRRLSDESLVGNDSVLQRASRAKEPPVKCAVVRSVLIDRDSTRTQDARGDRWQSTMNGNPFIHCDALNNPSPRFRRTCGRFFGFDFAFASRDGDRLFSL